jgi:hypothetical protein
VIDKIERMGKLDNTLIIYIAGDNFSLKNSLDVDSHVAATVHRARLCQLLLSEIQMSPAGAPRGDQFHIKIRCLTTWLRPIGPRTIAASSSAINVCG